MGLILEDGTGEIEGANSYASVEEATEYLTLRGLSGTWDTKEEADQERYLILATDYLDQAIQYRGLPLSSEQPLSWPREGIYDPRGVEVQGIPTPLKRATAEMALRIMNGVSVLPDDTEGVAGRLVSESESVGEVSSSKTYSTTKSGSYPVFRQVMALLRPYVASGPGVSSGKVIR